jgi:superfamily I DNA and/or RNA helicase
LRTDRKLLVSISRAVERFYIFGNPKALQAAPAYSELLEELS